MYPAAANVVLPTTPALQAPWNGTLLSLDKGDFFVRFSAFMVAVILLLTSLYLTSRSPKLDARFNDDSRQVFDLSEDEIEEFAECETKKDEIAAKRLNRQSDFVNLLTPKVVEHATRALVPFLQENRLERIDDVLSKRTRNCRFLFENPANPSNVWACLRTIDSFGIQNIDLIVDSPRYQGKAALAQKRGMRTAMGSAQWLTLRNYASTKQAVEDIKSQGYRLYASDLNPNSRDIRDIDWTQETMPICIVMGNENDGISEEMRNMADETFTLPMSGFAESFNLSVATAITLAHLSACSKDSKGPLRPGDMTQHEVNCLRLRGILNSLAHKKLGKAVLKKEGIELPKELGWIH
jgi:tRNA (guanosine-2'-O-)-methyltransferase